MFRDLFFRGESRGQAVGIFLLLVVQQAFVASSTVCLALAARSLTGEGGIQEAYLFGGAYLLALLLPYPPGIAALHLGGLWRVSGQRRFIDRFLVGHSSRPELWRSRSEEEKRLSSLTKESAELIQQSSASSVDGLSLLLNVSFNAAAVVWVLEPYFIPALVVSVLIGYSCLRHTKKENACQSEGQQESSREHNRLLLRAWDNVVLGNQSHLARWSERERRAFENYRDSSRALSSFQQTWNFFVAMGLFLPVLCAVIYYALQNVADTPALAAMLVTLPRLFMLLNFAYSLLTLFLVAGGLRARWANLETTLQAEAEGIPAPATTKLRLHSSDGKEFPVTEALLAELLTWRGRYRLSGGNGSGKSTTLLRLKEMAGERAMYLPPASALELESMGPWSTGQRKKEEVREALMSHAGTLLLDEWDGPLDGAATGELSQAIGDYAAIHLVVEVSHR